MQHPGLQKGTYASCKRRCLTWKQRHCNVRTLYRRSNNAGNVKKTLGTFLLLFTFSI